MKRVYGALVILSLVAILCVAEYTCVCQNAKKYIEGIEYTEKCIRNQEVDKAIEYTELLNKNWKGTVSRIDMLLYHDYVDEIGTNLAEMQIHLGNEEYTSFFATSQRTKKELESLYNSEQPLAENII